LTGQVFTQLFPAIIPPLLHPEQTAAGLTPTIM